MNEDGGPADAGDDVPELFSEDVEVGVEADEERDVLYGPEAGESDTTRLKSSVLERNIESSTQARAPTPFLAVQCLSAKTDKKSIDAFGFRIGSGNK